MANEAVRIRRSALTSCAALALLCVSSPAQAQRFERTPAIEYLQRRIERGGQQPAQGTPVRRLPRLDKREPVAAPFTATALDQFIEEQRRKLPEPRANGEDRVRTLVRSMPEQEPIPPLTVTAEVQPVYPRPRPLVTEPSLAGVLPTFEYPDGGVKANRITSRWRLGLPGLDGWQRTDAKGLDVIYAKSHWWDPFNQNVIKGDFPIFGRRHFLNITGSSNTLVESRRVPVPSGQSTADPMEQNFFGRGEQLAVVQSFRVSFDFFRGSAGFKPVDYEIRFTPEFNVNFLQARETGLTRIDVRRGTNRTDTNVGIQELFFEKRLFTNSVAFLRPRKEKDSDDRGSAYFDFTSLRVGIQRFTSDFRGFIFSDEQPGTRLFGTLGSNRYQYNLVYFNMLEKDTNSGLNTLNRRNQSVYIANLYWLDFFKPGYNVNFSLHYNNDQPSFQVDKNGFLVRPAPIGLPRPHRIRAAYAGMAGDGHIGRINISHAFYQAFGRDEFNPVPASKNAQHINAQMAALELAYEKDWAIYRVSSFFTSGDRKLNDGRANGFDAIVPNQQFAGGGFLGNPALADRGLINNQFEGGGTNFLNRQLIPLTGTGVFLFGPNSLIPNLRSSPFQGQANFVNPGILLFNAGMDAKLTPKLRSTLNVNYLRFHRTEVLQALLFQGGIRKSIGVDSGLGLQYRPKLNENIVITSGVGALIPNAGFKNLYTGRTLFSAFAAVRFLF